MPTEPPANDGYATIDMLELSPSQYTFDSYDTPQPGVELVSSGPKSLTTTTTTLLHGRLRAVVILMLVVYGMVFVWALVNRGADVFGAVAIYRNVGFVRLVLLGGALAVLLVRKDYGLPLLRGVEYALFGALTLLWAFSRYETIMLLAEARNITALLLDGRTSIIGLFLLMIVHGIFIPHRWLETARVVLTMALAPALVLVVFATRHPDLARQAAEMMSWEFVGTNTLIEIIGALIAIYASYTLHDLREEIHDAKRYGQYQLVRKLGSGGMGDVHLAEHVLMKRPCALKLIRSQSSTDPTALARFEREVKTTAGLTHPHTIEIYDYGHTDDGTFYYVMEYLPGLSLAELLAQHGHLPPGRAIYLLRQACSALAEAHAAGLIHRDLKPGNIYISERGGLCDFVKVLDFGLVKRLRESNDPQLTGEHVVSGTPHYMSPEQALGEPLDARSDLYALGAIAYTMLTGRPPFPGDNVMSVMMAHARDVPPPVSTLRPEIPKDLEQVVLRCLEKNPADRYADANQLEQALAACAAAADWDARQAAIWWHNLCVPGKSKEEDDIQLGSGL